MVWIGFVLLIAIMAVPWVLTRYLGRLPYAPECPHCQTVTVTGQRRAHGTLDRACEALTATAVRTCTRCGWAGRMRWRLAPERVNDRP
jgi:hypothetical protein